MKLLVLSLLGVALAACSTPAASPNGGNTVAQAATAPLSDLNLVRADIPPVLIAAQKAHYAVPAERSCGVAAGTIRRAYLKGLGQAAGCAARSAPRA